MKTRNWAVLVLFCMAGFVAVAATAEEVDNPNYKPWTAFKPGSWAKYSIVSDGGAFKTEMTMTMKLLEVTPEKAVIEASTSMTVQGQKIDTPPQKTEIKAKMQKPAADAKDAPQTTTKEAGEEEITVSGKNYKCKVLETTTKTPQATVNGKTWTSEQVPGGTVKAVSKVEGQVPSTTTMVLAECEAAK